MKLPDDLHCHGLFLLFWLTVSVMDFTAAGAFEPKACRPKQRANKPWPFEMTALYFLWRERPPQSAIIRLRPRKSMLWFRLWRLGRLPLVDHGEREVGRGVGPRNMQFAVHEPAHDGLFAEHRHSWGQVICTKDPESLAIRRPAR